PSRCRGRHRRSAQPRLPLRSAAAMKTQRAQSDRDVMTRTRLAAVAAAVAIAPAVVFAAPVHADPDTDFANELHTYGIYGQKDYNAWIGKITCKRLYNGLDKDAISSAAFVHLQLDKDATTEQAWQFLGASLRTYCPDKLPVLEAAAHQ